jgi:hypothetical protein
LELLRVSVALSGENVDDVVTSVFRDPAGCDPCRVFSSRHASFDSLAPSKIAPPFALVFSDSSLLQNRHRLRELPLPFRW